MTESCAFLWNKILELEELSVESWLQVFEVKITGILQIITSCTILSTHFRILLPLCMFLFATVQDNRRAALQKPPLKASCLNRASPAFVLQASLPCQLPVWLLSASSRAPASRPSIVTSPVTAARVTPAEALSVSPPLSYPCLA